MEPNGTSWNLMGFGTHIKALPESIFECWCLLACLTSLNLPGWCWARIKQLALIGSSSSLHSEACKALGGSDGVVHSTISLAAICMRAVANFSDRKLKHTSNNFTLGLGQGSHQGSLASSCRRSLIGQIWRKRAEKPPSDKTSTHL